MPVYLCQPGFKTEDAWRHGIQVFAAPFPINDGGTNSSTGGGGRDLLVASVDGATTTTAKQSSIHRSLSPGQPIRRVRHAEVVIVDDICVSYNRYWLRLRWPGSKGGFAGYIAMGLVSDFDVSKEKISPGIDEDTNFIMRSAEASEDRTGAEETDVDDPTREEQPSEPFENECVVKCIRTGIEYQTSPALRLMAIYDDGISPSVSPAPFPTEPVFCRICREGLHDDADEEQPKSAAEDADDTRNSSSGTLGDEDDVEPVGVDPTDAVRDAPANKGPVIPHPHYSANSHALENPLLAPCECSGSMAFVHYLCVEQWRCRSRHPEAKNGLNCETCGTSYALPPPSARPAAPAMDQEDWLDAMPPHVLQALRQPHICWQIGAAVVRRRYLRPIAPVLMSPLVAIYCRARRLLKKRGVARRRWACSLCRRRARWKCVRCLRSYYCSRQCQNVSWHIVHKHVCYKPVRFWWSVGVYGAASLALFPGILRDPLMYDLGLGIIPLSFVILAMLGGGIASCSKSFLGMDMRGRFMEAAVVLATAFVSFVSWKLIQGFFGSPEVCHGTLGAYIVSDTTVNETYLLQFLYRVLLQPAEAYYLWCDRKALNSGLWLKAALCTRTDISITMNGCFEHLPSANADFFFHEEGGGKCAADLLLVSWLYIASGCAFVGNHFLKRHERERRGQIRRAGRNEFRPHQD
jgi:hypothetical protein